MLAITSAFGGLLRRILTAALLAATVTASAGCGFQEPPPVSEKVQAYYDEHVVNAKPTFPSQAAVANTVVFIGDSYTSGVGASSQTSRWSTKLAQDFGWNEVNLGAGGTGYFNDGPSRNYSGAIARAAAAKPAVVIVSGGRNDVGFGAERFTPAINEFFTDLRKAMPKTKIIVTSPIYDDDPGPEVVVQQLDEAIQAEAEAIGATYVDIGEPLLSEPALVAEDGIHPSDAGHAAIAAAVKKAVSAVPSIVR